MQVGCNFAQLTRMRYIEMSTCQHQSNFWDCEHCNYSAFSTQFELSKNFLSTSHIHTITFFYAWVLYLTLTLMDASGANWGSVSCSRIRELEIERQTFHFILSFMKYIYTVRIIMRSTFTHTIPQNPWSHSCRITLQSVTSWNNKQEHISQRIKPPVLPFSLYSCSVYCLFDSDKWK